MRNLSAPNVALASRRGSSAGLVSMLASPNQSRYKGLISTPGIVKFSAWKRENDIPKIQFHEFLLQKIREKAHDKLWIKDVSCGRVEYFGQVNSAVARVASALSKLGFGKSDGLVMYCSNYVEYWIVVLAAWSCGGCITSVNCELDPDALEEQIKASKAKILVCDEVNVEDAAEVKKNCSNVEHLIILGSDSKAQDCIPIKDLLGDDGKSAPKRPQMNLETDVIYMPFSSTSSGSKGIMHTNRSLLASFYSPDGAANHWFDQLIGDSVMCGNWFFHMTGLYTFVLSAVYGITLYTLSDYSDTGFMEAIVDNKVASATLYPWQIRMLSHSPEVSRYDLSCLKVLITGGGLLSATIRVEVMERIPTIRYVREAYGLNETGLVTLTYPREKKNSVTGAKIVELPDDHVMPVGMPNMYTQIKIINRQTGSAVSGPDEQGEICIKSPQCFIGYQGSSPNLLFDSEGYFKTGDLGYYDSQGCVYFIESIDNLIHFWMYEVAPSILESRLLGSNNIVDAAVVGIPDKENGQVPRAFVVLKPGFEETEENLTNLMESRLQDHERIRGGLYFIKSIPRDENWKVRRDILAGYQPKAAEDCELGESAGLPQFGAASAEPAARSTAKPCKTVIEELERQPNGAFIALSYENVSSPRAKRSEKVDLYHGRRGSMDCIKEDSALPGRRHRQPNDGARRAAAQSRPVASPSGSSRRESLADTSVVSDSSRDFAYWLLVTVHPEKLELILKSHPAVDDCAVQGFEIEGIGKIPRAYVALKSGYQASSEELIGYVHSRALDTECLKGGIVFVEKLPKDPSGKLFISLSKFDADAEGLDEEFLKNQPKVKT